MFNKKAPEEIAEDYGISVEDVRAALLYACRES